MKGSRFSDDVENSSLKSTEKFLPDCSDSQTIKNSSSYVSEEEFLISTLKSYYHNLALKKNIKIAEKEYNLFGKINRVRRIFEFLRENAVNISIAAVLAITVSLSVLYIDRHFLNNSSQEGYKQLRRDIDKMRNSHAAILRNKDLNFDKSVQCGGTGFLVSSDGYVVTNYHVVKEADSVILENAHGDNYRAVVNFINPDLDIALLKINDDSFEAPVGHFPILSSKNKYIGEEIYTLGYPRDEIVYDKGYLSSQTGFEGDSLSYQVAIPVNPGNSGGPLFDNKGEIIGMITGKQNQPNSGIAYAIKSTYILKSLSSVLYSGGFSIHVGKRLSIISDRRTVQLRKLSSFVFMVKSYN